MQSSFIVIVTIMTTVQALWTKPIITTPSFRRHWTSTHASSSTSTTQLRHVNTALHAAAKVNGDEKPTNLLDQIETLAEVAAEDLNSVIEDGVNRNQTNRIDKNRQESEGNPMLGPTPPSPTRTLLEVNGLFSLNAELNEINTARIRTQICNGRAYARPNAFAKENITNPPTIDDLLPLPVSGEQSFYTTLAFRLLSFFVAFFSFPYLAQFAERMVDIPPQQLNDIVSKFVPGVTILYGTMISLTLSLLYARQRDIQNSVAKESALLSIVFRNLISLFKRDQDLTVEAGKCVAEQVRTLVRSSRGKELMGIVYADPYARIIELIDTEEERIAIRKGDFLRRGPLLSNCRDLTNQLTSLRAERLSHEANSLSPTHFQILNSLTLLILIGYILSVLPTLDDLGYPSNDSSVLFGILAYIYLLFSLFADDLNEPFFGVYQLRRSASAVHFLTIKWIISNNTWLRDEIDFEDSIVGEEGEWIKFKSPGVGEVVFENNKVFSNYCTLNDAEKEL